MQEHVYNRRQCHLTTFLALGLSGARGLFIPKDSPNNQKHVRSRTQVDNGCKGLKMAKIIWP